MAESPGPSRIPSTRTWRRLWQAAQPDDETHAVDLPTLGEYGALLDLHDRGTADAAFPTVAQHLGAGCQACDAHLQELLTVLAAERRRRPQRD